MDIQYSEKIDRIIYSRLTDDFEAEDWHALAIAALDQAGWEIARIMKEVRDETPSKAS